MLSPCWIQPPDQPPVTHLALFEHYRTIWRGLFQSYFSGVFLYLFKIFFSLLNSKLKPTSPKSSTRTVTPRQSFLTNSPSLCRYNLSSAPLHSAFCRDAHFQSSDLFQQIWWALTGWVGGDSGETSGALPLGNSEGIYGSSPPCRIWAGQSSVGHCSALWAHQPHSRCLWNLLGRYPTVRQPVKAVTQSTSQCQAHS